MNGSVAVVAHYDPDGKFDPTFQVLLKCLGRVCERLVVVTTSHLSPSEGVLNPAIQVIERPNIGYDFYSYRVGIETVIEQGGAERLFLVNSSFLVIDAERFISALEAMQCDLITHPVVGCVESLQWQRHLQSYLMLFRADVLQSSWFMRWIRTIQPRNSKLETIIAGEFGLSNALADNGIATRALLQLSWREKLQAINAWVGFQGRGGALAFLRGLRHATGFNPAHFAAQPLVERCGIVKTELLRDNPCGISLDWYEQKFASIPGPEARAFVQASRKHYQSSGQGLTVLGGEDSPLPSFRFVSSGPLARPGARIAVVLHLFYPELIDEIRGFLRHILEPFDLFVTTPHEGALPAIFNGFGGLAQTVAVAVSENRGRDIGPFMSLHREGYFNPYSAVLKVHGKRSKYSEEGDFWRRRLFTELCGTSAIVDKTLKLLREDDAGVVGPHDDYLTSERYWGANRETVSRLLKAAGVAKSEQPELGFFAGSMFWFRPAALAPLHTIPLSYLVFEPEAGKQDGTLAHAIERVFSTVARSAGYTCKTIRSVECDIRDLVELQNSVPVLPQ